MSSIAGKIGLNQHLRFFGKIIKCANKRKTHEIRRKREKQNTTSIRKKNKKRMSKDSKHKSGCKNPPSCD